MRFRSLGLVSLISVTALTLAGCSGGNTDGGSGGGDKDSITIGIKFDQPGLGLQDGSDYKGLDVDVARYVAKELGYDEDQIEWLESPSAQRENLLETGQVDMIFATYSITDERKAKVAFAGPYFVAGQDLLVAEDDDEIDGPDSLDGKKLCSVTGSTSAKKISDEHPKVQLQEYPGYADCVTALVAGAIDAVTTDDVILAGLASQPANKGKVKVVGNTFSEEKYGVGIAKDSDKCEDINTAITKMIDDGTWKKLVDANVGESGFEPNAELNPPKFDPCA